MPEVVVALNTQEAREAQQWVTTFAGRVRWFKVGLPLFTRYGPEILFTLRERGAEHIFLDLKIGDIPSVMAQTVRGIKDLPVRMLTVNLLAGPEAMESAREACPENVLLVGVTVLSSLDTASISQILPSPVSPVEWSLHLARMAREVGIQAVVASGDSVMRIRDKLPDLKLVVPGIRWGQQDLQDQRRILTPDDARLAQVDYLVVGRPLTHASDPLRALQELEEALTS